MSEYIYEHMQSGVDHLGRQVEQPTLVQRYEIVRCRDCMYNAKDTDGICYRFDYEHFNQPDGFCAWGQRMTEQTIATMKYSTLKADACEMILMWSDYEDGECYRCSKCGDFTYTHGGKPRFCQNCGSEAVYL